MPYNVPKKVNVPELFYQRFVAPLVFDTTATDDLNTLLTKLDTTETTKRGRGLTRRLEGLTHGQWNELYRLAANGRAHMQNCDRETTLRPAICARVLADRMEVIGVDSPVVYTAKRAPKVAVEPQQPTVATVTPAVMPINPPTVVVDQTADVEEADDEDLDFMYQDILGN